MNSSIAIPYIAENGQHLDYPFLVMEKAKGAIFGRSFHPPLARAVWGVVFTMAKQIASALDTVHAKDIVHRDIKPNNIVVDPDTGKAVSHLSETQLTAKGVRIGHLAIQRQSRLQPRSLALPQSMVISSDFLCLVDQL